MRNECVFENMAAWRKQLQDISAALEQDDDELSNEEMSIDNSIPLAGYADHSDQEASEDEWEISRKSSTGNGARKKAGRKSSWKEEEVADMVDIVCNSDYYKKKIIFTNSKNSKNNDVYSKLQKDLQARLEARGQELQFTVEQVRNKLKKLISECKRVALTIKTATGVDRFQENKNYGSWFPMLFSLVKTRDSCQPERAVEPSSGSSEDVYKRSGAGSPAESVGESEGSTDNGSSDDKKLFVPVKSRGKKRKNVASSAVKCMEKLLERDPTKDLLEFYREENEKARRHELQLMQMIMSVQQPTENVQPLTQVSSLQRGYMAVPPQHAYGYMESGGMHQVQGRTEPSVGNSSPTFFSL